jgi:23S rRNA (cytidine1920-2'-O)/16S rRNA (cytidine1409-2'-O)-methyltransferase
MSDERKRVRLDELLVERELVDSLERGRRMIRAGEVRIGDAVMTTPGTLVPQGAEIQVEQPPRFVGRGGEKLDAALRRFGIDPDGRVCADVGASTGGFTDCLLQAGAARVYAVDAGYGQLAWKLRQDERVVSMERVNARYLDGLPEPVSLVTVDVSFISLRLILPNVQRWLTGSQATIAGEAVVLVKPQFEADREDVGEGGIVRSRAVHRRVLLSVIEDARAEGFWPGGVMPSPLHGAEGNVEFLLWLRTGPGQGVDVERAVEAALDEAHAGG